MNKKQTKQIRNYIYQGKGVHEIAKIMKLRVGDIIDFYCEICLNEDVPPIKKE